MSTLVFGQPQHSFANKREPESVMMRGSDRTPGAEKRKPIVLIEKRAFVSDCLSRSLEARLGETFLVCASVEEFSANADRMQARLVILCACGNATEVEVGRQMLTLSRICGDAVPTMLLSEREQPNQIVSAMEVGVRGYITTSLPLEVAAEAIRLVDAGGIFVPAHCLIGGRKYQPCQTPAASARSEFFTVRQQAVVNALRRGKANKAIAYELNMRESTVKVHVRNVMRKLKARNRTEVAFLASELLRFD